MAASNTAEYRTLQSLTNELSLAVKQDLTGVCGALFSVGLITRGICDELGNALLPKRERAAQLIGIIQDKVQEGPHNYQMFISVLEKQGLTQYGDILHKLEDTYKGMISLSTLNITVHVGSSCSYRSLNYASVRPNQLENCTLFKTSTDHLGAQIF